MKIITVIIMIVACFILAYITPWFIPFLGNPDYNNLLILALFWYVIINSLDSINKKNKQED
ncbi:hypothetical protein [Peribacillus alkalitolerans]|uniref:hypothetical protein n=1 Tax=Peribacillus alkalitolerans TaxID=1550385 RepID=UPI0013D379E1|nr:hypothetical protein [Peribacillus alkalitolerans]